ncbi:MAG TPA: hypothetical protein PKA43_00950 [Candidatus Competibacter phosphatis]|nr:hypothetical protein [Candidatus Competibacter phosphatis]
MEWWRVGLALGLPWLAGVLWLRALWRNAPAGIWPMALGYGGVLGLLAVTLLLRVQAAVGLPLNFAGPITVLTLLALAGGWLAWRRLWCDPDANPDASFNGIHWSGQKLWRLALFVVLLLWLGWRLVDLAQEIWWQPLYPWDAWTTWTVRPRVWSEWHQLLPFVDLRHWLADTTGSVYTIDAWTYPYTVPLLALWPTLAYGAWNETAANLPWLGVVLALGLGFYGQARLWGVVPLTALIFTWLLLSLPLLDTHVALAGYADLWLATVFGLAVIALFQWARDGDRRQGWLALLLALACPSIKLEGVVWLFLFLPMLLTARLRGWWLLALAGVVLALGWVWWLTGGVEFNIPGLGEFRLTPELIQVPYLGRFALGYRGSWDPVMMNFLVLVNWHLLGYLMLLATGVAVVSVFKRGATRWQRAGLVFVVTSLLALFVLFFLTDAQRWAEQYTSINRVFLEFVPAFLFWVLTVFHPSPLAAHPALSGEEGSGQPRGSEYPSV